MEPTLSQIVEAIIFVADQPVNLGFIRESLDTKIASSGSDNGEDGKEEEEENPLLAELTDEKWEEILSELTMKYADDKYPFEIRKVAGGCQFLTKRRFHSYVKKASLNKNQKKLSRAALETLSIIAYRQPITKAEMEFIRGVNCDYAVQKLLDKNLVNIVGRSDGPGRPLLYGTSPFFMQYFGLNDMNDMPKLKEFEELAEEHQELFRQHQIEKKAKKDGKEPEEESEKTTLLEGGGGGEESPQTPDEPEITEAEEGTREEE